MLLEDSSLARGAVGVAIGGSSAYFAFTPPAPSDELAHKHDPRRFYTRHKTVNVNGRSNQQIIESAVADAGFTPTVVGVVLHDGNTLDFSTTSGGVPVIQVPATQATLAGINHVPDNDQFVIQPGSSRSRDHGNGVLKIGPKSVSYLGQNSHSEEVITGRDIAALTEKGAEFARFIGAAKASDGVEFLGNRGWTNAAKFLLTRSTFAPDVNATPKTWTLTQRLIHEAVDPASRRILVRHICVGASAPVSDPFCADIAAFQLEQLGSTVGMTVGSHDLQTLFVQYNAISAVSAMPSWAVGRQELRDAIKGASGTRRKHELVKIVLTGPRLYAHEAYGAAHEASVLVVQQ